MKKIILISLFAPFLFSGCVPQPLPNTSGSCEQKTSTLNDNTVTALGFSFDSVLSIHIGDNITAEEDAEINKTPKIGEYR